MERGNKTLGPVLLAALFLLSGFALRINAQQREQGLLKACGGNVSQCARVAHQEAVSRIQGRPRPLAFEHGDSRAQSEDLQGRVAPRTEENAESIQHSEEQIDHELKFVARGAHSMPRSALTIDFTMR